MTLTPAEILHTTKGHSRFAHCQITLALCGERSESATSNLLNINLEIDVKLTEQDHIFDGFAHRNFNEEMDGWRNEIPTAKDYPSVLAARDTVAMFNELVCAKRRIWELEQELKIWKRPL